MSSNRHRGFPTLTSGAKPNPEDSDSLTIHEEKLAELDGSVDKFIIKCGDVNIPFSVIDWTTTPPVSKNEQYQPCLPN